MTAEKKTVEGTKTGDVAIRKAWVPRSPVEVVLDQIKKQEHKVAEMQAELDAEKAMLTKLLQAKKLFEST